ncbi:pH-response regulator protein palC [Microdochium trichocladiopsis]|uniref:pH-response regulator protein palC n=1 Tax=Microdochium trichocladiopsis TaxID=1682393 RepID=A0A9P8YE52_9PEZI|nr:pH-response regulator protein palC [Microdochium trichocladiopsis]KAH7035277.1 pH-response regulator protein palC [Microdochium trichocladiopsis]
MPFPFTLPTTSSFTFSSSFQSDSHPSLPLGTSDHRARLRDTLKKHKRLPATSQPADLPAVVAATNSYLPYLFALDAGLSRRPLLNDHISLSPTSTPSIEWRPTLSDNAIPGRETARVKLQSLENELSFTLATLGYTHSQLARAALHPLYSTSEASLSAQARTAAITTASKHLLDAASVHSYLAKRGESHVTAPPCPDIAQSTAKALSLLALAEAIILAVLKDDPYPAIVAQDRNQNDREWMYRAPEIPKVRVHLLARLCLAAADHAAQASSLCQSLPAKGISKLNDGFLKYLEDFRKTCRAKACRFLGLDADMSGQTGTAIGWLRTGLQELGVESTEAKKGLSLSRMKKDWSERREDKKVEKGTTWGSDGGKFEEIRILEMLNAKWSKMNDTMLTQTVPAPPTLLAGLPSGRDPYSVKTYEPPELDKEVLDAMRAPPRHESVSDDHLDGGMSSGDEDRQATPQPVGAFPSTQGDYRTESARSYY